MEKFYLSKTLLKLAGGGGGASPTSPLDPPLETRATPTRVCNRRMHGATVVFSWQEDKSEKSPTFTETHDVHLLHLLRIFNF